MCVESCMRYVRYLNGWYLCFFISNPFTSYYYNMIDDKSLSFLFSDYANEDGLCSQHMLKRPIVSVLNAEHARIILRQSSFRKQMPLTQRHLHFAMGRKSLVFSEGGQDWVEQESPR